jgi:hypothetical protein
VKPEDAQALKITVFIIDNWLITKGGAVRDSDSRPFESIFGNVFRQSWTVMLGNAWKHLQEGFTT